MYFQDRGSKVSNFLCGDSSSSRNSNVQQVEVDEYIYKYTFECGRKHSIGNFMFANKPKVKPKSRLFCDVDV